MLFFLNRYQAARKPRRLSFEWREGDGDEVVDFLLRNGILKRNPVGSVYPCGRSRTGCFREIMEDPAEEPGSYVAVCPNGECSEVALTAAQVEEYWVSHEDFARWLRSALRLGGEIAFMDPKYPDTVQLGTLEGPEPWDVFVSLGRDGVTLDVLLAKRRSVERPSIVLAPATRTLPQGIRDEYPPGGHVVLGVLADLLHFEQSAVVVHHSFYDLTHRVGQTAGDFGEIHTHAGVRPLTAYEYPTWIPRASEFDMFIDAIGLAKGLMASYRTPEGGSHAEALSPREARILVELVRRPKPTAVRDLEALRDANTNDWKSLERMINRARAKVEHGEGRNRWQIFRNVPSPAEGPHRLMFNAAEGIRFVILAPAPEEEAPPSSMTG